MWCRKPDSRIGGNNEQFKLITHKMEVPVPYSFHTEYRKKVLYGQLRNDVREILKKLCEYKKVEIVEGAVCPDHVHLCVCIPPKLKVSDFMGYLKGKPALMIYDKNPKLASKWDKSFWARGYYVATVGNITEEAIKKYIQEQQEESKKEEMQR